MYSIIRKKKCRPRRIRGSTDHKEDWIMCAKNLGEILTPEELADRLKVSVSWIYEKRRPRCANPIPALPMGRLMRFDWETVVEWLSGLAEEDANSLRQRRTGSTSTHRTPCTKKTAANER